MIKMNWMVVLNFAEKEVGIFFIDRYLYLRMVLMISRVAIIMTHHIGMIPLIAKAKKAESVRILSESGSSCSPSLVARWYFLAMYQSRRSERAAMIKMIIAAR